ncbi:small multi-drug export protein [Bacillus sp. FJAT-45350]|uniref:small multi-drug export protein n=1 Tax=Bacillus sp. FJAT-45350 TaxID=2011014 RepID=UPI001C545A73|nr:small multi-drug export protein [Bacillus sp. FJAT-45350]
MEILSQIWPYILIFILSAIPLFEAMVVIPIAIVAGLPWVPVLIVGLIGNVVTVLIVIIYVEKIKEWRNRRKQKKLEEKNENIRENENEVDEAKESEEKNVNKSENENVDEDVIEEVGEKQTKRAIRAQKIWKKYGLPGLALIGPFIVGSHITALMSLSFGGTKKSVTYWVNGSVIGWCILLAVLAHIGLDFFISDNGGFLSDLF